ncbi:MAG: hypothetical protein H0T51_12025, partial [Pirellulales bacterium]|nr:hypothetical protein [Pirellulales bacterium]
MWLLTIGSGLLRSEASAQQPQIVRWEIAATVTYIVDPGGFFPDVRLGDPVRGTLKYDLTLLPNPIYSGEYYYDYTNETWAAVASMVIENPRTGQETDFAKDSRGNFADVYAYDDYPQEGGAFDMIFAVQSVMPPPGFVGGAPAVAVQLLGPSSNWSGYGLNFPFEGQRLPSLLNLDDFPLSAVTFYDAFFEDEFATTIEAEIYSLTPITSAISPGDFDFNGDVDGGDLYAWQVTHGSSGVLYA